jgi:dnd system-associated protein 4
LARAPNINRSRVHEPLVQRLAVDKLPELGKSLFPTIREFLSFAALLGYSEGRKIPLDGAAGTEDIGGGVYEHHEAMEIIFALAIAETESSDILKEGNEAKCAKIYEEYANGGLELVSDWLTASADQSPDKAIFAGLLQAGYLSDNGNGLLEDDIAKIEF